MTAEQFAYWMQGFAELTGDTPPTKAQWKSMTEHLATVFVKVTPPVDLSKLGPAIPHVDPFPPSTTPLPWRMPPTVTCSALSGGDLTATLTC